MRKRVNGNTINSPEHDDKKILHRQIVEKEQELQKKRKEIGLFKTPLRTISLFASEALLILKTSLRELGRRYIITSISILLASSITFFRLFKGFHSHVFDPYFDEMVHCAKWMFLGVLSSVGLGTGLHTFLLNLGPFIAKTTFASGECGSLDFDLYGKNAFVCPLHTEQEQVTMMNVIYKVEFAVLCWGLGTAIGELPPYFVARGARLSGKSVESVEGLDFDKELKTDPDSDGTLKAVAYRSVSIVKSFFHAFLTKYTFITILVMASIPNPLFDLAGVTCGYSLIPFKTFFGATVIGKAIIKANLQAVLIVLIFSRKQLDIVITFIENIVPSVKQSLENFIAKEVSKFHPHSNNSSVVVEGKTIVGIVWDVILALMISWFLLSIITSMAVNRASSIDEIEIQRYKKKLSSKGHH
ncbi:vacuolar membrane protein 1 [Acrasis kona]|uniref:Vacuolar membrane protein 1 n=1 Tax=Acrasis kona TaxID=1008807 RepID=A0AAW2YMT0_9EUKA